MQMGTSLIDETVEVTMVHRVRDATCSQRQTILETPHYHSDDVNVVSVDLHYFVLMLSDERSVDQSLLQIIPSLTNSFGKRLHFSRHYVLLSI